MFVHAVDGHRGGRRPGGKERPVAKSRLIGDSPTASGTSARPRPGYPFTNKLAFATRKLRKGFNHRLHSSEAIAFSS